MCHCDGINLVAHGCAGGGGGTIQNGVIGCGRACDVGPVEGVCVADVEVPCEDCQRNGGGTSAPAPPTSRGKPVSLTTGNVFFTHTDAVVGDLALTRTFHSGRLTAGRYGLLGPGWNFSFEMRVRSMNSYTREVRLADGFAQYYIDTNYDGVLESVLPVTKDSWLEALPGGGYKRSLRTGGFETFRADGKIESATDAVGVETTYTYDERTRLTSVSRRGRSITFAYWGSSNRPWQVRGPGDVLVATYSYDATNTLTTVEYPDGSGYRFGYDSGRVVWIAALDDNVIEHHVYDGSGRALTSEIGNGREKLTFSYLVGKTVVTDAVGVVNEYEYATIDFTPRVTSVKGPCASCGGAGGSGKRVWTYDGIGNVIAYQNELGDIWRYTYDGNYDLVSETNPLAQTTTYTRYPDGRVQTRTGPDGSVTSYTHGPAGPLSITEKVSASETRTTSMTYTAEGKLETITDPRDKVTRMTYNATGDLETVTDPLVHTTRFGYDDLGRRTTVQDALSHTTTTQYDARGRATSVIQHDGTHTDFAYDKQGRRTSVTDPELRVTRYTYDAYGRLEKVVDPMDGVTMYGYDLMGNLTSLTDAMGRTTRFVYELGRVVRTIYPGAAEPSETFAYDPAGRLVARTDRKGTVTTFEYDALGRLKRKAYSDGTPPVTYSYDENGALGRLTSAANGTDTLRWSYDLAGQLTSEQSTRNGSVVSYSYDPAGNRISISLDGQVHVSYGYDDASRLTAITRGSSPFGFGYDDANRRTSMTYPNGVATSYSYDDLNRLTNLQALLNGTTTITSFAYTYDQAGNRLTKATPDFAESYSYDPLYRLTGVDRTGTSTGLWSYGYDGVGNRTTAQVGSAVQRSAYNEKNQLLASAGGGSMVWRGTLSEPGNVIFTSALVNGQPARMLGGNTFETTLEMLQGTNTVTLQATDTSGNITTRNYQVDVPVAGTSYTYDSNGNLTGKTEGTDNWTYTWNAENQLIRVEKNGAEVARFAYDPKGRRIEKAAGGVTTSYTFDAEAIVREVRGTATLKYVQGPGMDEPLATEDGSGGLACFHADWLGSIVKTTGAVTSARQYDAWGNLENGGAEPGYAFTGREWDPEIGLYYYRARYYDARVGRFLSEDPAGLIDGPNRYPYVQNRPADRIDPTGRLTESEKKYCRDYRNARSCGMGLACMVKADIKFWGSADNTPENASKHCYWSCCIARSAGATGAYNVTTAHEAGPGDRCEHQMDMSNNAAGLAFGLANRSKSCDELCDPQRLQCKPKNPPCF